VILADETFFYLFQEYSSKLLDWTISCVHRKFNIDAILVRYISKHILNVIEGLWMLMLIIYASKRPGAWGSMYYLGPSLLSWGIFKILFHCKKSISIMHCMMFILCLFMFRQECRIQKTCNFPRMISLLNKACNRLCEDTHVIDFSLEIYSRIFLFCCNIYR